MTQSMKRIHNTAACNRRNTIGKVAIKRIPDDISQSDVPCIGIVAECEIWTPHGKPHPVTGQNWLCNTIESGGLWGLECGLDAESSYCKAVEQEQLDALREVLHAIDFSRRAITAAFRKVVRQ